MLTDSHIVYIKMVPVTSQILKKRNHWINRIVFVYDIPCQSYD